MKDDYKMIQWAIDTNNNITMNPPWAGGDYERRKQHKIIAMINRWS